MQRIEGITRRHNKIYLSIYLETLECVIFVEVTAAK